jgi:hypothetical protein
MKRRLLLSLLSMWLGASAAHAALEPRPQVRVTFSIEAGELRDDLGTEADSFTATVQARVRDILEKHFPYFDWVTTGTPERVLKVTLRQRQAAGDLETVLEYQSTAVPGEPLVHVLYDWLNPPPHDAPLLKESLLNTKTKGDPGKIPADVLDSAPGLRTYFISQVPLVKRVDMSVKHILLPVSNVHPETARFLVKFDDADAKQGRIKLFEPLDDGTRGIVCRIDHFNYTGTPEIDAQWHDSIPTVVKEKARNVRVIVEEFTPRANPNTSGGSVTAVPRGEKK